MSSRPTPGRRPDSLFDNRYRIDHAYPRGRSGEVLRALDTLNNDQPVIIKRPALQDAPPMRAGQEQNILNEKRALERLGGHASVPKLLQMGIFRVSGQAQHYIVLDLALGSPLDALINDLAERGYRLPDLEMLVIFDALLDVIQAAHDRKMIYNNLDPANLFWDRERYTLQVAAWENALFVDTDVVPPGISRATDIAQVGNLLYFVASGGQQLTNPEDLGSLDVLPQIVPIISRAISTEAAQRYTSVVTMRQELDALRSPLEEQRDAPFEHARSRLPEAQIEELEVLLEMVQQALEQDPGYPAGHTLLAEIESRIRHINVQNEMHALSVYMMSGNLGRAASLIEELRPHMDAETQPIFAYLLDACEQLQAQPVLPLSAGFTEALGPLLEGDVALAARLMVTTYEPRSNARQQQNLLAERLSLYIPGIVLLRPPLALLEDQLIGKPGGAEVRDSLRAIITRLDRAVPPSIQLLRRQYQETANALVELQSELGQFSNNGDSKLVDEAQRAHFAAQRVLELLDEATGTIFSDPPRAAAALEKAATIDPASTGFKTVTSILESFQADLDNLHSFAPAKDGSNITQFFADAQARLRPYGTDVADPHLQRLVQGVEDAAVAWDRMVDAIALGGRRPAVTACQQAAKAIEPLSPALARWFSDYGKRIEKVTHLDELNPNTALGAALEQGWELWDRGRADDAKAAGEHALTLVRTDGERQAVRRLINLSDTLGTWLANDGPLNRQRTDQADERVSEILLPEEESIRRTFSKQMPDAQIYLRAMSKGIVEPMRESSAAGGRALFLHYVLRGMLALQGDSDDSAFWREAAIKTLPHARTHPAFQALDAAITRRQLVKQAVKALNAVTHTSDLGPARQAVRAPMASAQLEAASQAVQSIDEALRSWTEGDFRKARQAIDNAAERMAFAETVMSQDLKPFRNWLQDLGASAEIVQQARRTIEQAALVPADDPNPTVAEAYHKIVEITRRDLGEAYTTGLRQWRDTYNSIRDLYLDEQLTKAEKLRLYDGYADVPTFEQQPALPILRHWLGLIKKMSDSVPPPPPSIPIRRTALSGDAEPDRIVETANETTPPIDDVESEAVEPAADEAPAEPIRSGSPLMLIIGIIVVIAILGTVGVLVFQTLNPPPTIPVTISASSQATLPAIAAAVGTEPATETDTPTPSDTPTTASTSTPPTLPPTITRAVPTYTPTTGTPTPVTPTATQVTPASLISPTPLPVGVKPNDSPVPTNPGLGSPTSVPTPQTGDYDMLASLANLPASKITWNKDLFGPADKGWQLGTDAPRPNTAQLVVRLGPDVLTPLYGLDAARKLTRVDATIELVSYDKTLLPTGNVFYGIGLESQSGQRVTVQATLLQETVAGIGTAQNGTLKQKTEVPFTKPLRTTFTLERNSDSTVSLFYNGQLVGQSGASYAVGTPVTIYMYTSAGGVVAKLISLKVHLE